MNMKRKIIGFAAIPVCLLLTFCFSSCAKAEATPKEAGLLSPALNIICEENSMALCARKGEKICFSPEDFARGMNMEDVESITLTELPPVTDGQLRVGSLVLNGGQKISAGSISLMTYSANSDIQSSEFRFRVNDSPYEMTCKLYLLSSDNYSPTLSAAPKTALEVSTYQDVTYFGTLSFYDPDGDVTRAEIVSYPEKGILVLDDAESGAYRYMPYANASGKDEFTYVARDIYGNYSACANVSVEIKRCENPVKFVDLDETPWHNAAITMSQKNVMSGTQVGSFTYFYPDREVSRGEFTVMAMNAAGITDLNSVSKTVFADDADIPENMKSYIAAAYDMGYVKGVMKNGKLCFDSQRSITRAEAAVMLAAMTETSVTTFKPVFKDSADIPVWAQASVNSMAALGVLVPTDEGIEPLSPLTRGDAAVILSNFMQVK